jgi:hypothetical protein
VFVIDDDRIQDGEIFEFLDPNNNNNWIVKINNNSKFLNCYYNIDAFFTYQKAQNVLKALQIQKIEMNENEQEVILAKRNEKEKQASIKLAIGQDVYFVDKNIEIKTGTLTNMEGDIWTVEVLYKNEKEKIERNNIFCSYTAASHFQQKKSEELGIKIITQQRDWQDDWREWDMHY